MPHLDHLAAPVPEDEAVSLSIHAYPMPDADAAPALCAAYQEALAADAALRDMLELGRAVPPGQLRAAEDRALGSLLTFAQLA